MQPFLIALGDRKTRPGLPDGRRQRLLQGQAPVLLDQPFDRGRRARNAGRRGAVERHALDDIAGFIEINVFMSRERGLFAPIDHDLSAVRGAMQQPEAAAAEAGAVRLDHAQRGRDRGGRVKGIAALP